MARYHSRVRGQSPAVTTQIPQLLAFEAGARIAAEEIESADSTGRGQLDAA
jgi:hypothetical protein